MPKSIMIVDDSEMIRRNLREIFTRNGNWVICAEAVDGRDALEKARQFHPDFVVLDLSMPYMDGLEAAPKLKKITPHSSIVMLTAFKDGFIEKEAYKAGVSWVLGKDQTSKIVDFARILLGPDSSPASSSQYN